MKKLTFLLVLTLHALFAQDHWETAVFANDIWRYIVPNSEPSSNWKDQSFDDSNWNEGEGGFGYGDNDDGTIVDRHYPYILGKPLALKIFLSLQRYC